MSEATIIQTMASIILQVLEKVKLKSKITIKIMDFGHIIT